MKDIPIANATSSKSSVSNADIKWMMGCVAGSEGGAHNCESQGCEFKPLVGHGAYLKKYISFSDHIAHA